MVKVPIYQVIEKDIREDVIKGVYKQGDMVPSETELSLKYNVTRMTVRQALNNLVVDGYLYRHKGRGTFVCFNKVERSNDKLISLSAKVDGNVSTKVISLSIMPADELIASRLQLEKGENIYYIERIKYSDNQPRIYERLYLPVKMYTSMEQKIFEGSFYDYVEKTLNWKIANSYEAIEARALTKKVADLLNLKEGEPSLYISKVTYLDNGRAFEYSRAYYNAEHFRFTHTSYR
jgi:GntR family transcriptional regulator